jgi:hypothetical protein
MPADALPQSSAPLPGATRLRREYRDALGRPMTGRVRITGAARSQDGTTVIVPAAVNADVAAGVLEVELPAGTYTLAATLTTVDGNRADDTETVELL